MNINQLRKILKAKLRPLKSRVQVIHFWELFKMKYVNHLVVEGTDICFQIKQIGGNWKVLTMERNSIQDEKQFDEEKEACLYFKELIENAYKNELGSS